MKVKLSEDNIKIFKNSLKMLNVHSTDVTFLINKDSINILFMDPSQSMFFKIIFDKKFFEEYDCANEKINISSTYIINALNNFKDEVWLSSTENKMKINDDTKEYSLPMIGETGDTHEPHLDNDDATILSIDANELHSLTKEVQEIADVITFVKEKKIIQVSGNDLYGVSGFTATLPCTITKDLHEKIRLMFGLDYFGKLTPFLEGNLFIKMKPKYPIEITNTGDNYSIMVILGQREEESYGPEAV